ncbi:EAL domain-containing protein [Christensenellaceae bacterium OttesenSCG-928-K19]|nr:EAL domain-containing protein [Christensenellaceae bacterium OttesenSCG-928-K19]
MMENNERDDGNKACGFAGQDYDTRLETFIETLANDVFDLFTQTDDADQTIRTVLEMMGKAMHVSRAAVFELQENTEHAIMTYEWLEGDGDGTRRSSRLFAKKDWVWDGNATGESQIVAVEDCGDEESGFNKRLGEEYDIRARMHCYYCKDGKPVGSIYVDSMKGPRKWTEKERSVLQAVARVFNVYLYNMRQMQRLEEERLMQHAIAKNQDFHSYILKENSYEILHISPSLQERLPAIKEGDICYEIFKKSGTPCRDCPINRGDGIKAEVFSVALDTWVASSATSINLTGGKKATLVCFSDISEIKSKKNDRDAITGFFTEGAFKKQAEALLAKGGHKYALCFVSMARFNVLSEKKGVETCHQVLQEVAGMISEKMRPGELACRYFSDAILVLMEYEDAHKLEARVQGLDDTLQEWGVGRFDDFRATFKSGVYPARQGEADINELIKNASIAKDDVEETGCVIFTDEMHRRTKQEKEMEALMADALESGEFVVYMQPTVDLKTGRIAAAESLIRWHRSPGKMSMPGDFIPLFEKNGFIREMDDFMIEQVCKIVQKWREEGKPIVPVSINIAEKNMRDSNFVAKVKDLIQQYKIPPRTLELELREGMFEGDVEELIMAINALRRLGVTFAIDDYGTGASPLNVIRQLPVDVLKMDKDFFDHVHLSEKERAMLTHMIRLAKSLDMKVLYEGIESQEQEELLKDAGCDLGQGFLYGGPMSEDSFQKLLAAQ